MADDEEGGYVDSFVAADDGALMQAIQQRDAAIAPLIRPGGGNAVQALQLALADPPYHTRTEAVKVASWEVVLKALGAIKEAEIEGAVGALSLDECDVLMKYLYRGLGQPGKGHEKYQALLKWHPAVLKRAGQGSITRAISEVRQAL